MPADTTAQPMRTCPVCQGQFPITHHSTARHTYCSRRCRDIAANARDKAKDAEAEARLAAAGGPIVLPAAPRGADPATRPVRSWNRQRPDPARTAASPSPSSRCSPPRRRHGPHCPRPPRRSSPCVAPDTAQPCSSCASHRRHPAAVTGAAGWSITHRTHSARNRTNGSSDRLAASSLLRSSGPSTTRATAG